MPRPPSAIGVTGPGARSRVSETKGGPCRRHTREPGSNLHPTAPRSPTGPAARERRRCATSHEWRRPETHSTALQGPRGTHRRAHCPKNAHARNVPGCCFRQRPALRCSPSTPRTTTPAQPQAVQGYSSVHVPLLMIFSVGAKWARHGPGSVPLDSTPKVCSACQLLPRTAIVLSPPPCSLADRSRPTLSAFLSASRNGRRHKSRGSARQRRRGASCALSACLRCRRCHWYVSPCRTCKGARPL